MRILSNISRKHFYSNFIRKDSLCFDIGAHEGNRTSVLLKLAAKVVAVEPQPKCARILRNKFSKHDGFRLEEAGLASDPGILSLSICEGATTISTFSERWKTGRFKDYRWNTTLTVPVTTLDLLIKKYGIPDFCKIDVEGYEYQVLLGLSQSIPMLSFEFGNEFIDQAVACCKYLSRLDSYSFNLVLGEGNRFELKKWAEFTDLIQFIYDRNDLQIWGDIYARVTKI